MSEDNNGWFKYMAAANATGAGSIIAFLASAFIFFPMGYYVKYKDFKQANNNIIQQSIKNKQVDLDMYTTLQMSNQNLNDSLHYLGYDSNDIEFLNGNDRGKLDTMKNKLVKYLPGKVKYRPGKIKYVPKSDCVNDYVGNVLAKEVNIIIDKGFNDRRSQQ